MKTQVWLGQNSVRFWYYRYKDSPYYHLVTIAIIGLAAILLLFNLVLPQVHSWFSIRDEVIATNAKLTILRNNINLVNNFDKSLLASEVQVATSALPAQQEFTAILSALSQAAISANVVINDFSFQIDNSDTSSSGNNAINGAKVVKLVISVNGSVDNIKQFLQSMAQELPISNVSRIDFSGQTATMTLEFYQKPFSKVPFNPETPIPPLSDVKQSLLDKLTTWQVPVGQNNLSVPTGSSSGVPLF